MWGLERLHTRVCRGAGRVRWGSATGTGGSRGRSGGGAGVSHSEQLGPPVALKKSRYNTTSGRRPGRGRQILHYHDS